MAKSRSIAGAWRRHAAALLMLAPLLAITASPAAAADAAVDGRPADLDPATVHPVCFDDLVSQAYSGEASVERVLLTNCPGGDAPTRSYRDRRIYERPRDTSQGESFATGWVASRFVGTFDGGRLVYELIDNGGGTGAFSMLLSGRLKTGAEGPMLVDLVLAPAGDRCTGGIDTAVAVDDRLMDVAQWVTPFDVVSLILDLEPEQAPDGVTAALGDEAAQAVPGCAACCVGTVVLRLDAASLKPHAGAQTDLPVAGESLHMTYDGIGEYDDGASVCLAKVVGARAADGPDPSADPGRASNAGTGAGLVGGSMADDNPDARDDIRIPLEDLAALREPLLACIRDKEHKK
ncbi:hypothetical protein WG926_12720 [Tistrella sp. BH-R2-4]|uniref:Secreted protein n=1 Tax=Tistrella arctica TaxID=3133430 RepID=A0ABU9YK26_9PROT